MRWEGQRESGNVEDRRGMGPARIGGGLGIGGIVLVLAVSYFTGINPLTLINMLNGVQSMPDSSAPSEPAPTGSPDDKLGKFASVVLADTETTWKQLLGPRYEDPRLVLFTGAVQSACGTASSAVGPFYCPGDHKVYLDLSFFNVMAQRLGAAGDFASAFFATSFLGSSFLGSSFFTTSFFAISFLGSAKTIFFSTVNSGGVVFCVVVFVPGGVFFRFKWLFGFLPSTVGSGLFVGVCVKIGAVSTLSTLCLGTIFEIFGVELGTIVLGVFVAVLVPS